MTLCCGARAWGRAFSGAFSSQHWVEVKGMKCEAGRPGFAGERDQAAESTS